MDALGLIKAAKVEIKYLCSTCINLAKKTGRFVPDGSLLSIYAGKCDNCGEQCSLGKIPLNM